MRGIVIPVVRLSCGSEVEDFNIYSGLCPLATRLLLAGKKFLPSPSPFSIRLGPQGKDGLQFLHLLIKLHGCDWQPEGVALPILLTCEHN